MFGHDHRGHGHSSGSRLRYIVEMCLYISIPRANIDNVDKYVDDVISHCNMMKRQYPGVPLFIIGHSMGGLVAIKAVLRTQV